MIDESRVPSGVGFFRWQSGWGEGSGFDNGEGPGIGRIFFLVVVKGNFCSLFVNY